MTSFDFVTCAEKTNKKPTMQLKIAHFVPCAIQGCRNTDRQTEALAAQHY